MSTVLFLRPHLTGSRFNDHAIPLEFLKDLAVLEEMIVEVAKWKYLQAHPGRHRSPRGFIKGIEMTLTGVEDGSVIPVISLIVAASTLFPSEGQKYLAEARDAVIHAIAAAEHSKPFINEYLPDRALGYFDRLGRSLREGEAFEFTTPSQTTPARLTRETRRKLVLASSAVVGLTETISIRGAVPEADQDNMTFEIQLLDGDKIPAPISTQHMDTILEAFNGYTNGAHVLVHGVGKLNRSRRLQNMESIEHINILDPQDISIRVHELRGLGNGWLDGEGIEPSDEGLDWLVDVFEDHFPDDLPLPFIYPTAEGGVQAEWQLKKHEITLEIDFRERKGEFHSLDMEVDDEIPISTELALDNPEAWTWLAEQIRPLVGDVA